MGELEPLRALLSLLFVLALIGLCALGLRRWGSRLARGLAGVKNDGGRLEVLEVRYIDPRRRLVLVRRDDAQHLLLLSDGRELVVESGIAGAMMPPKDTP